MDLGTDRNKFFFLGGVSVLIQAIFDIGIPILGTLIWTCRNLILRKTETTITQFQFFDQISNII